MGPRILGIGLGTALMMFKFESMVFSEDDDIMKYGAPTTPLMNAALSIYRISIVIIMAYAVEWLAGGSIFPQYYYCKNGMSEKGTVEFITEAFVGIVTDIVAMRKWLEVAGISQCLCPHMENCECYQNSWTIGFLSWLIGGSNCPDWKSFVSVVPQLLLTLVTVILAIVLWILKINFPACGGGGGGGGADGDGGEGGCNCGCGDIRPIPKETGTKPAPVVQKTGCEELNKAGTGDPETGTSQQPPVKPGETSKETGKDTTGSEKPATETEKSTTSPGKPETEKSAGGTGDTATSTEPKPPTANPDESTSPPPNSPPTAPMTPQPIHPQCPTCGYNHDPSDSPEGTPKRSSRGKVTKNCGRSKSGGFFHKSCSRGIRNGGILSPQEIENDLANNRSSSGTDSPGNDKGGEVSGSERDENAFTTPISTAQPSPSSSDSANKSPPQVEAPPTPRYSLRSLTPKISDQGAKDKNSGNKVNKPRNSKGQNIEEDQENEKELPANEVPQRPRRGGTYSKKGRGVRGGGRGAK